jgi:hypothetical protein
MSAIRCNACTEGFLLPVESLKYRSDWSCHSCKIVISFEAVDDVMATLEKQASYLYCRINS